MDGWVIFVIVTFVVGAVVTVVISEITEKTRQEPYRIERWKEKMKNMRSSCEQGE